MAITGSGREGAQRGVTCSYHFVPGFGKVDLHVHRVWRGVHHLLLLFLQTLGHSLDGFGPFFPEEPQAAGTITLSCTKNSLIT